MGVTQIHAKRNCLGQWLGPFPLFVSLLLLPRVSWSDNVFSVLARLLWHMTTASWLALVLIVTHSFWTAAHAAFPFTFLVGLNWLLFLSFLLLISFSLSTPLPFSKHLHCRSIALPRCPTLLAPGVTKWRSCWRLHHPGAAMQTRTCLLTYDVLCHHFPWRHEYIWSLGMFKTLVESLYSYHIIVLALWHWVVSW